jgi:murein DD-endopeptidase MepM/ murein hydrolase activator NlpD
VIEFAGWKGGYGNFVKVKHNGTYATGYGHASRIAKGIKPGVRVKQGQVIAYVGSTGRSTGPHLHYEVFVNNTQVNPSGVKFRTGNALAGNDLKKFKAQVASVQALMKNSGEKEQKVANTQPTAKKKNGAKKS